MAIEDPPSPAGSLSLRLRLTLGMVLIFLVVQLSLVSAMEIYQRRSIEEFFDERILDRQRQIAADLRPLLPKVSEDALHQSAETYRKLLFQSQFVIEVFDDHGRSIAASHPPRADLPEAVWKSVEHASEPLTVRMPLSVLRDPTAVASRSAAGWVAGADGKLYLVLVAWSDIYAQKMLRLLFGVVFISIPIGVLAMIVSGYAISGVAVRPINAVRQMAKWLEPDRLSERLPASGAGAEIAALRQDLEGTRKRLEAAFATQERFMSNVSHELKTPIAVLMTEAQTLKLEDARKELRTFVSSALDELDKLGRMVDSFLLLTRVRHGKAAIPNRELCLARDVMAQSYEGCAPMAAQYDVRLVMRLPDEEHLDVGIYGNCDLLRTILDNLIRNAIRFSPKGHVVEVDGRVEDGRIIMRVRDKGPGIPAEVLPRIFDRFAQSSEEQRRGRGHGLGLEIAMGITELHGGTITAANSPDGGCEFTVSLPAAESLDGESAPAS
jgi:signal transduction histidine kinase